MITITHEGGNCKAVLANGRIEYWVTANADYSSDSDNITVTRDGTVVFTADKGDITIDGESAYGTADDVIEQIQAADVINKKLELVAEDTGSSSSPYLVYAALLTQSSTDPIAATVLQNTMGTVTASAFSTDEYILLETTIDYNPAKVFIGGFATAEGNGAVYVPIISGAVLVGYYSVNAYAEAGKLAFQVAFYTDAFAAASMSSLLTTNRFSMPEVRVYE